MATVKANGIIKYLVFAAVGFAIFIGVLVLKGSKDKKVEELSTQPATVVYDLTESEQSELGLTAGDTPHDTLKTILGAVKDARADVRTVKEQNEKLKKERNDVTKLIDDALKQQQLEFDQRLETLRSEMGKMQESLVNASPKSESQNYPIGGQGFENQKSLPPIAPKPSTKWVEPTDVVYKDKNGNIVGALTTNATATYPNPFKALDESVVGEAAKQIQTNPSSERAAKKNNVIPFFTIPQNSTLLGATSMTALIGRIPIDGKVTDPYPFKIIVGQDNLIANGIELPDVERAIVSGTSTGDWTLSCVQGKVESISFVFSDGTIASSITGKDKANSEKGIGWLSNPNGVQCISGERKTNALEYLTSQFLLSGASAAAQGLAQGQTTTVVDNGSVFSAVTGNQGKFILGQALAGGLKETTDWFRQRYGQNFDAIYVPPGQSVAVHITQELRIDYNPNGRKVKYHHSRVTRSLD